MFVALRPDQEAHLRMLCEQMGRSADAFVREAVLTFMEDYEDGRDADVIMKRVHSGEEKTHSLEEVMKKYEMEAGDHPDGGEAVGSTEQRSTNPDKDIPGREDHHAA